MLITKLATVHGDRLRVREQYPPVEALFPTVSLIYIRGNDLRERIPCPVEARFDRSKITLRDLSNLLVGLAFELTQNEDVPVVLGKLGHALLYDLPQVPLAVHVIRARRNVLELKRTILILEVFLNRLEK